MLLDYIVTDKDRAQFRSYTDASIRGIRLIASMTNTELEAAKTDEAAQAAIRTLMGSDTNPYWISAQIAEELFYRNLIDEIEFDYLTR